MFLEDKNKSAGVETKADPFTLDALIAWLRTRPGNEEYCWTNGGSCLYGQYGEFLRLGVSDASAYLAVINGFGVHGTYCNSLIEPFGNLAMGSPRTFGGALDRALAIKGAL